jgi:hypothetical protein
VAREPLLMLLTWLRYAANRHVSSAAVTFVLGLFASRLAVLTVNRLVTVSVIDQHFTDHGKFAILNFTGISIRNWVHMRHDHDAR